MFVRNVKSAIKADGFIQRIVVACDLQILALSEI